MKRKYIFLIACIIIGVVWIGLVYFSPVRQWHKSKICNSFTFSENIGSNLDDAIKVLETKYEYNITTTETTKEVLDKNDEWVTKTIYIISIPNKGPAALDSEGNIYYQVLC